jgi:hypothetical protein
VNPTPQISPLTDSLDVLATRREPDGSILLDDPDVRDELCRVAGDVNRRWEMVDRLAVGVRVGTVYTVVPMSDKSHRWVRDASPASDMVFRGKAKDGDWWFSSGPHHLLGGGSVGSAHYWHPSHRLCCLVLGLAAPAAPAIDLSRFPDKCLRCGAPAYLGGGIGECSRSGCR